MLVRMIRVECLKLKRTPALWMVAVAPVVMIVLSTLMFWQRPSTILFHSPLWTPLTKSVLGLWALLMMPLFVTLETALMAGFEHSENQWKSLLALPVERWTVYIAKLLVVIAMLMTSATLLALGIGAAGTVLPYLQPELRFDKQIPWLEIARRTAQVLALALPSLAIQHWVSLRWRSFAVALGVGTIATVSSFFVVNARAGLDRFYPWSLPGTVLSNRPINVEAILISAAVAGFVLVVLGCWDFCRRELV